MKKVFALFFTLSSLSSFSQNSDFWDHVRFGGGFSLGFSNQSTTIGISPSAIYQFDNGFALGSGVSYLYSEISDFSTNVYGASIISLYQIPKVNIQLSTDLEYYFAKQTDSFGSYNTNFPALHFGVAYNQGRFAVGVRYDVLYDKNKSIFASPFTPIIRFYF